MGGTMNRVNTKKEFLKNMPKEMKVPKHWKKFLNEQAVESNLFIKHGNEYECTNCGKYFFSKQVEGCWEICPFCNNQYDVKRSNLKKHIKGESANEKVLQRIQRVRHARQCT